MRKSKANKTHLFKKEKRKIRKNYMVYSLWTGLWSSGAIFSPNKEPVHRLHGIRRDVLLSQRVKLGTEHRWSPFSALIRKSIYMSWFLLVMATCTKQLSTSCGKKSLEGFVIPFLSVRLPVLFRPTELPWVPLRRGKCAPQKTSRSLSTNFLWSRGNNQDPWLIVSFLYNSWPFAV